ncbi:MAG TPA: DUF4340 domain-containing protein [Verrucomicrobiae bacterium]|jgi:hypothetical protein|nr:DUF4340 domain-containing protein [Verrucomicrobiae bacterium]
MNGKQFIALVILVALVGAAGWIIYQRGNNSWQTADQTIGGKLLPNLPINDVAQIDIQSGTNQLTLARNNNIWSVRQRDNYPANFSQISDLLVKLGDLKIVQTVDAGPAELPRFNLSPPGTAADAATLLELKDQSKTVASLLLGKDHMNQPANGQGYPDGRYVIANTNSTGIAVVSETFDSVAPRPADWLDKTFFKVANPKSIAVTFPVATNSWKVTRASETNDWQLADVKPGEKFDSSKVEDITGSFDSPSFNDVSKGATAPKDAIAVSIETFGGTNYSAKLWPSGNDNDSMTISMDNAKGKPAAENPFANWTFQVPTYTFESLLKPRTNLLETVTTAKK